MLIIEMSTNILIQNFGRQTKNMKKFSFVYTKLLKKIAVFEKAAFQIREQPFKILRKRLSSKTYNEDEMNHPWPLKKKVLN